jgi:tRNA threonylcarbamoyladenosine biosynthesis protein TsaE
MIGDALTLTTHGREETLAWGRRIAARIRRGDVVALYGDLGSGKTVFAQGLCAGLGVAQDVTSPTFTIIQEYTGPMRIFHVDLYRIGSWMELEELGMPSILEEADVAIVEWAEKAEPILPAQRFSVRLEYLGKGKAHPNSRRLSIRAPKGIVLEDLAP